ncbi:M57 family metalloprotease [Zunongwangia sp. F363]|uniref:M57 family metalloprotease n=1 Tax=Autumnicola tepida TaxID=3075595 RepID=A0ABU3C5G9_9FLAO|nr:M57 family metalloprotease [Zunongwangia sp. F363]MDT0641591.1 M57 family metalloprotease [Zunongwangia sp. F363]
MKRQKLLLSILTAAVVFTSCQKEDETIAAESPVNAISSQEEKLSKENLDNITRLHFNDKGAKVTDFLLPDGSIEEAILLEGDILMSTSQLNNMSAQDITSKQYRTYNLVSSPKTINVIGFTANSSQGLTDKQKSALQRAITNYNSLNIGINFTLTFGTNYQPYDIVVYQNSNGEAGGVAGFPANGNPYKYVQIFSGMESYSTATNEHVLTHEIGHSVGLRHTDWYSRQSCGQSGESAGSDGAVHIPGTPTGYDSNSIMLACFSANEDGNFGYYDEVALNYLY